jgi:hypothetical protein
MSTRHTCNDGQGPHFGRRTPGCARCDELDNGAQPVVWSGTRRAREERAAIAVVRAHDCAVSRCGPVCTFGDW